jgi:hypothetical protein
MSHLRQPIPIVGGCLDVGVVAFAVVPGDGAVVLGDAVAGGDIRGGAIVAGGDIRRGAIVAGVILLAGAMVDRAMGRGTTAIARWVTVAIVGGGAVGGGVVAGGTVVGGTVVGGTVVVVGVGRVVGEGLATAWTTVWALGREECEPANRAAETPPPATTTAAMTSGILRI